jgi:alkylated DNA repair dioxygenase AlkB
VRDLLDLDRYLLDQPGTAGYEELVARCRRELEREGMFNLEGLVRPSTIRAAAEELAPLASSSSYTHARAHNVYFLERVEGVDESHAALKKFQTVNHTLCDDQLTHTFVHRLYEWQPLVDFIARVLDLPQLYLMDDPLARANVMEYRPGEALNWHFDRSRYTTTLLIQSAQEGGEFQYCSDLRADGKPNYDEVGRVLTGETDRIRVNPLAAGTLNVFAGKNSLHRVSTVQGQRSRLVAVFSYYERPGVLFSEKERLGFYGRS